MISADGVTKLSFIHRYFIDQQVQSYKHLHLLNIKDDKYNVW
jgi:hypothetical protein